MNNTVVDDPNSKYIVQISEGEQSGSQSITVSDQSGNVVGSASVQDVGSEINVTVQDSSGATVAQVSYGDNGSLSVSIVNDEGILTPVLDVPAMDPTAALGQLERLQALFMECGDLDVQFFQVMTDIYRADLKESTEESLQKATEALDKQQQASKGGKCAKAFGWIATIAASVAAVAIAVCTCGAGTMAGGMLIASAALMLTSQISAETGDWLQEGMTKMCGGNEMAGMIVLMVAITALSLGGAGLASRATKAAADAAQAAAKGAAAAATAAVDSGVAASTAARTAATAAVRSWGDDAVSIAQKTVDDALANGATPGEAAYQGVAQAYSSTLGSRISSTVRTATYAQLGSEALAVGGSLPANVQQFKLAKVMEDLQIAQADLEEIRKIFEQIKKSLSEGIESAGVVVDELMQTIEDYNKTRLKAISVA